MILKKYKFYYIYLTENLINNKKYVGFHATNKKFDNYLGSGKLLKKAIIKYDSNNFNRTILENVNIRNWSEKEKFWIKKLNTHVSKGGYNLTEGGERNPHSLSGTNNPMFGKKHSQETINKMKRKKSASARANMSKARKGKSYDIISHLFKVKV